MPVTVTISKASSLIESSVAAFSRRFPLVSLADHYAKVVGKSSSSVQPGSGATDAELIKGKSLIELEALLPLLADGALIDFNTLTTDDGFTFYFDANLVEASSTQSLNRMNYPTAEKLAREHGTPVARASWFDADGNPTKWLTYERGAFYLYTAEARSVVKADSLNEADYRAQDWRKPDGCSKSVSDQPDIGGESQAEEPTFDILNPPCSLS